MRDPLKTVNGLIVDAPVVKLEDGKEYTVPQIEAKLKAAGEEFYNECQNTGSSKFTS